MRNCLTIVGSLFNFIGSIILIYPAMKLLRNIEEERIEDMDDEGNYYRKIDRKIRDRAIIGFGFNIVGFFLQFIGQWTS